jgi:hypothetical protein
MTEDSRHGTSMGVVCAHTKPPKHLNLVVDRKSKNRSRRDQKMVARVFPDGSGLSEATPGEREPQKSQKAHNRNPFCPTPGSFTTGGYTHYPYGKRSGFSAISPRWEATPTYRGVPAGKMPAFRRLGSAGKMPAVRRVLMVIDNFHGMGT